MDGIKLFAKNEKEFETLIQEVMIYCDYIKMKSIRHRKMCRANKKKRQTTNKGRNRTTKSRKNQNARKKRKLTNTWEYWKRTPSSKRR